MTGAELAEAMEVRRVQLSLTHSRELACGGGGGGLRAEDENRRLKPKCEFRIY